MRTFPAGAGSGRPFPPFLARLCGTASRFLAAPLDRWRGDGRGPAAPGWCVVSARMPRAAEFPHVEAVLNGELPPAPLILMPVKFVGGLLAIGAGLRAWPRGALRPNGRDPCAISSERPLAGTAPTACLCSRRARVLVLPPRSMRPSPGLPSSWKSSPGNSTHATPSPRSEHPAAPSWWHGSSPVRRRILS